MRDIWAHIFVTMARLQRSDCEGLQLQRKAGISVRKFWTQPKVDWKFKVLSKTDIIALDTFILGKIKTVDNIVAMQIQYLLCINSVKCWNGKFKIDLLMS